MSLKSSLQSRTLALWASGDSFVSLALNGSAQFPVRDLGGEEFGAVTITVTALARVAMLEHIDQPVPPRLREAAKSELPPRKRG